MAHDVKLKPLISEGRIRVNDHIATLGERVEPDAVIRIDGHKVKTRDAEEAALSGFVVPQAGRRVGDARKDQKGVRRYTSVYHRLVVRAGLRSLVDSISIPRDSCS